jgi:hypothetical protein
VRLWLISDEEAQRRWGQAENPYAGEPGAERTYGYQQAELEIALRQLWLAVALALLRWYRRLPFCE